MAPTSIPSCCLTAEQKDALIDAVHDRPVIWDCSLADYQEVQNRRAAFIEVAELLSHGKNHYTGPEMQVEWKKLRDIFNRTLKKVVANGGGDGEVTWRYWSKLQFIADHERTQIFKAMQKWSKKMPSASRRKCLTVTSAAATPQSQNSRRHHPPLNFASVSPPHSGGDPGGASTPGSSVAATPNMVQQLADVAQTAKELLEMEGKLRREEGSEDRREAEEWEDGEEEEMAKEEEEEEEEGNNEEEEERRRLVDPLCQILLLGSQMQQNNSLNGGSSNEDGDIFDQNGAINEIIPPVDCHASFNELIKAEKLLNELLAKGSAAVTATENSTTGEMNMMSRAAIVMNGPSVNGTRGNKRKAASVTAIAKGGTAAIVNGTNSGSSSNGGTTTTTVNSSRKRTRYLEVPPSAGSNNTNNNQNGTNGDGGTAMPSTATTTTSGQLRRSESGGNEGGSGDKMVLEQNGWSMASTVTALRLQKNIGMVEVGCDANGVKRETGNDGGTRKANGIGGNNGSSSGGGGGQHDQFDIFGMFIASQVRTLHAQSPQSARKLKRALTELCFRFEEAEQQAVEEQRSS